MYTRANLNKNTWYATLLWELTCCESLARAIQPQQSCLVTFYPIYRWETIKRLGQELLAKNVSLYVVRHACVELLTTAHLLKKLLIQLQVVKTNIKRKRLWSWTAYQTVKWLGRRQAQTNRLYSCKISTSGEKPWCTCIHWQWHTQWWWLYYWWSIYRPHIRVHYN